MHTITQTFGYEETFEHRRAAAPAVEPDLLALAALSLMAAIVCLATAGAVQVAAAVTALTTTALGLLLARQVPAPSPALVVCRPVTRGRRT
jgi:hypothetical protein